MRYLHQRGMWWGLGLALGVFMIAGVGSVCAQGNNSGDTFLGGDDYDAMKFYNLYRTFEEGVGTDFTGCEDVKTLVEPVSSEMVELAKSFEVI